MSCPEPTTEWGLSRWKLTSSVGRRHGTQEPRLLYWFLMYPQIPHPASSLHHSSHSLVLSNNIYPRQRSIKIKNNSYPYWALSMCQALHRTPYMSQLTGRKALLGWFLTPSSLQDLNLAPSAPHSLAFSPSVSMAAPPWSPFWVPSLFLTSKPWASRAQFLDCLSSPTVLILALWSHLASEL